MPDAVKTMVLPRGQDDKMTILIVDDDANFRNGLKRQFWIMKSCFPSELSEAGRGDEAFNMLQAQDFDCMLLDYRMPGGNGIEWMKKFFSIKPHLPVIVVTGEGDEDVAVSSMKNGAADYLVKGAITNESIRRAISNATEKERMRRVIDAQRNELIEAERQRVMIESLGAACHHLGQPATVIHAYLEILKRTIQTSPESLMMIDECLKAATSIADVLDRLKAVSEYRRVPYIPARKGETTDRPDQYILAI